ncbi:MAG TPA: hypothetical protein VFI61_00170 [Patescibacteria group bacterium]|nr:hypothetical protein [Patescibacteria group bacterium]
MKGIENVYNGQKVISVIFKNNSKIVDSVFVTQKHYPMQVGIHASFDKKKFSKHIHNDINIADKISCHEVLLVQSGVVTVDYFSKNGRKIATKKLKAGDGVLIMDVIHQVTLSKNSKVIEIKQGPYVEKK